MFLCVILFNCKMPMQVYSKLNFPKTDDHIGAPYDLIVFIVFYQFGVIS